MYPFYDPHKAAKHGQLLTSRDCRHPGAIPANPGTLRFITSILILQLDLLSCLLEFNLGDQGDALVIRARRNCGRGLLMGIRIIKWGFILDISVLLIYIYFGKWI